MRVDVRPLTRPAAPVFFRNHAADIPVIASCLQYQPGDSRQRTERAMIFILGFGGLLT
jgi:hypothetical protein